MISFLFDSSQEALEKHGVIFASLILRFSKLARLTRQGVPQIYEKCSDRWLGTLDILNLWRVATYLWINSTWTTTHNSINHFFKDGRHSFGVQFLWLEKIHIIFSTWSRWEICVSLTESGFNQVRCSCESCHHRGIDRFEEGIFGWRSYFNRQNIPW